MIPKDSGSLGVTWVFLTRISSPRISSPVRDSHVPYTLPSSSQSKAPHRSRLTKMESTSDPNHVDPAALCVLNGFEIDPKYLEFPIDVFEIKEAEMTSDPMFMEFFGDSMSEDYHSSDSDLSGDTTASTSTDSPMDPVPAPVPYSAATSIISMDSFFTLENTKGNITNGKHAFNIFGCIVYMARFPGTQEGWAPILKLYGYRPNIVEQVAVYINDPKSGVVHDAINRVVAIRRRSLSSLIRGWQSLVDVNDRIITHFGDTGESGYADTSKYFSGLRNSWEVNMKKGCAGTYLNTFNYVDRGSSDSYFEFPY